MLSRRCERRLRQKEPNAQAQGSVLDEIHDSVLHALEAELDLEEISARRAMCENMSE